MPIRLAVMGIVSWCIIAMYCTMPASAEQYEVFIIAGQSNCDGRGDASALTGELSKWAAPQKDVLIAYSCSSQRGAALDSGGFKPLQPGYSVAPGKGRPKSLPSPTFGPEVSFGRGMADGLAAKHVALIKYCEGGTSLKKDWNPDSRNHLYDGMIAFVGRSLKQMSDQGHTCQIRGMIWHQGESDAALPAQEYQAMLTAFIGRVRKDFNAPDMPFGIGEVYDNKKRDQVRAAQKATAAAVPHAFFVSAEGLKTKDGGTHFDAASQIEIGSRFAQGMLKALAAKPE